MSMDPDIAKVLSYEIRKELAEGYFGFRKIIEEDKQSLDQKRKLHTATIEQQICLDLARIYILLQGKKRIHEFLALIGLQEEIFYDPYLLESSTIRARVFEGVKVHGLTRKGRFANLVLDSYGALVNHVKRYMESIGDLIESRVMIEEEIKLFYRKHDLGTIMGFLRSLDSSGNGNEILGAGSGLVSNTGFEERMRVELPEPIDLILPIVEPLKPLPRVKKDLKRLANEAYREQNRSDESNEQKKL
jgi:hypothetical protein